MNKYLLFLVVFVLAVCVIGCDNAATIEVSTNVSDGSAETNTVENVLKQMEECK